MKKTTFCIMNCFKCKITCMFTNNTYYVLLLNYVLCFFPKMFRIILLYEFFVFYLQLQSLNLNLNKIGNEGAKFLSTCIHNIDELRLSNCDITKLGIENLSKAIQKKTSPVNNSFLRLYLIFWIFFMIILKYFDILGFDF